VIVRPVDVLRGGGCALNTSSALAKLGMRAAMVWKVGADAVGNFIRRTLEERSVDASRVLRDATTPTSASVALVDASGERTFLTRPGANATLSSKGVQWRRRSKRAGSPVRRGAAWVVSAASRQESGAKLGRRLRLPNVAIRLDPALRQAGVSAY
jgi:sugar/nucleoside kinase (ribokinase family)